MKQNEWYYTMEQPVLADSFAEQFQQVVKQCMASINESCEYLIHTLGPENIHFQMENPTFRNFDIDRTQEIVRSFHNSKGKVLGYVYSCFVKTEDDKLQMQVSVYQGPVQEIHLDRTLKETLRKVEEHYLKETYGKKEENRN